MAGGSVVVGRINPLAVRWAQISTICIVQRVVNWSCELLAVADND